MGHKVGKEPPKKKRLFVENVEEDDSMSSSELDKNKDDSSRDNEVSNRVGSAPSCNRKSNSNLGGTESGDESLEPIEIMKGGDILSQCRLLDISRCPPIPLCRMWPYPRVRGLRDDYSSLKDALEGETYCPEKGTFIVFIVSSSGESIAVTPTIRQAWDPHWQSVDKEFEGELKGKKSLSFLANKMFYVWEGNHRTLAWMELINEKYRDNKSWHFRVVSTVIDPSKLSEVSLLAGLLRMNNLNEHAVIKTNLRDVLVNASNLCDCDFKLYLKEQTSQVAKTLEAKRKLEAKSSTTWYPLAREDLAQLVYQVEFQKEMCTKLQEGTQKLSNDERVVKEKEILSELKRKYNDRMQKVLNVINPSLGREWREVLFSLRFDGLDTIVGIEKLNLLAISSISSEKKLYCLRLLESSKSFRTSYGMPTTNSEFRAWLSREVLLDLVEKNAIRILDDERRLASIISSPIELPNDPNLHDYFAIIRNEGKKSIYGNINKKGSKEKNKKKEDGPKQTQLDAAAYRLIYRFLLYLKELGLIVQMPDTCKGWRDISNNATSMYVEMGTLSPYDIEVCPWWLDMPFPHVLEREKKKFAECSKIKGQTFVQKDSVNTIGESSQGEIPFERVISNKGKEIMRESIDKVKPTTTIERGQSKRATIINLEKSAFVPQNFDISTSLAPSISHRYVPYEHSRATFPLGREYYSYGEGDYIAMGKDFASSIRNEDYARIHTFFVELDKASVNFTKKGKVVAWAADFVFLDLPSSSSFTHEEVPSWNTLTEDHVRHGIGVAGACLRDSGWLVCLVTLAGNALTWLEKYVSRLDLEIVRRFVIENVIYSGEIEVDGIVTQMNAFCMYMIRRKGFLAPMYLVDSLQFRLELGIDFGKYIFQHHLPEIAKAQEAGDGAQIRGRVQLSVGFVRCILESLCPPHGLVVEMGCGTAPLMRACMVSGRPCFSFDSDPLVVDQILSPLVERVQVISEELLSIHSKGSETKEEGDGYDCPFDYVLPCYAEKVAESMCGDERYDMKVINRGRRRKEKHPFSIFIENECHEE